MTKTLKFAFISIAACLVLTTSVRGEDVKKLSKDVESALQLVKDKDGSFEKALKKAYGYVVFPHVSKGGFIVGGAGGSGLVYEGGKLIGSANLSQGTIGAQIGGQVFVEVVLLETKGALERFKESRLEMSAQISAVAAAEGVGSKLKYENHMAVVILPKGGLMAEASIGGQKFDFKPLDKDKD